MTTENLLLTLSTLFIFSGFVLMFWMLPGLWLLSQRDKLPVLERLFLAMTGGFALYASAMFLVRMSGLPFWVGMLPIGVTAGLQVTKLISGRLRQRIRPTKAQSAFVFLALIGMVVQGLVLFRSGVRTQEGLRFTELSFHDSIWHIYLIDELKEHFPPRHAGFAPALVKNYHFLLDLTIASIGKYLPISSFELYYRVVPAFVSMLFSLGLFVMTRRLCRSEWLANIAVALTLFAGNASWFTALFRGPEFTPSANTFMLDPILDLLQNPHAVIVFAMMLAGIMGLRLLDERPNLRWTLYSVIVLGPIIGLKAWGGMLVLLSLPLAAAWKSLTRQRHDLWIVWILAAALSLAIFIPLYDHKTAAGIVFIPGWLLKRMVEDPDRYNMPSLYFLEQQYRETGNIIGLVLLNLKEFFIYLFGNLWIRVLGFVYVLKLAGRRAPTDIFMIAVVVFSLSLPVLFNQGRMSYDIIQFGPYGIVLFSIFTACSLQQFTRKLSKTLAVSMTLLLLILSVPSNLKSIRDRAGGSHFVVSNQVLEAFAYVQQNTTHDSILLVYPSHRNLSSAMVAALTKRITFFSADTFSRITGEDYEGREKQLKDFFFNVDPQQRQRMIQESGIDFIFLLAEDNDRFNPQGLNLRKVFSNEETAIYEII